MSRDNSYRFRNVSAFRAREKSDSLAPLGRSHGERAPVWRRKRDRSFVDTNGATDRRCRRNKRPLFNVHRRGVFWVNEICEHAEVHKKRRKINYESTCSWMYPHRFIQNSSKWRFYSRTVESWKIPNSNWRDNFEKFAQLSWLLYLFLLARYSVLFIG